MQRGGGRASREAFALRDPFAGFGGMSSIFGGREPFDDPFFTRPFGSVSGSSMFDASGAFDDAVNPPPAPSAKGLVIKELNSDGVEEDEEDDEQTLTGKSSDVIQRNDQQKMNEEKSQVKSQSFSYRKVTYGGVNGAYRTSTVSRRTGSDGVVIEESKAANKTTGQAEHRISRGIQNKGHSVTRMLKPDGKVETMQMLHNLNEDELAGFEESWKGNAGELIGRQQKGEQELKDNHFPAAGGSSEWDSSRLNWDNKLQPIGATLSAGDRVWASSSSVGAKKVVRIPIE